MENKQIVYFEGIVGDELVHHSVNNSEGFRYYDDYYRFLGMGRGYKVTYKLYSNGTEEGESKIF